MDFSDAEQEYWFHVSSQEALPLAGVVAVDLDLDRASTFFKSVAGATPEEMRQSVAELLVSNPSLFGDVRQFLGISDKRAYLDLSYIASRIAHPEAATALCGCQPWTLARHPLMFFIKLLGGVKGPSVQRAVALMMSDYLLKHGLESSAPGFAAMSSAVLEMLYARLISPKEYQQRAAKRRGHGCEAALAAVLAAGGLDIIPPDKASNPMGARDPNVDLATMEVVDRTAGRTHSFDMVLRDRRYNRVLVQSLIHTSDPGQYGVNKSDETVAINQLIKAWNITKQTPTVELWALLDGVGFSENKPETINKLLTNIDYFIQLNTLFKAPLRAHKLGLMAVCGISFSSIYSINQIEQLAKLYVSNDIQVIGHTESVWPEWSPIIAGNATIYVSSEKKLDVQPKVQLSLMD